MDQLNQPATPTDPRDVEDSFTNILNGSLPLSEVFRRMAEQGKAFLDDPVRQTRNHIIPALQNDIIRPLQPVGAFVSDLARRNTSPANSAFRLLDTPAPGSVPPPAAPGL
jgi:hypothetical protein